MAADKIVFISDFIHSLTLRTQLQRVENYWPTLSSFVNFLKTVSPLGCVIVESMRK